MFAAKAVIGLGATIFAAQAGAVATGTPITVENVSITFSGIALIWFGKTMLKVRDTVVKLQNRDQKRKARIRRLEVRYHRVVDALLLAKIPVALDGPEEDLDDDDEDDK